MRQECSCKKHQSQELNCGLARDAFEELSPLAEYASHRLHPHVSFEYRTLNPITMKHLAVLLLAFLMFTGTSAIGQAHVPGVDSTRLYQVDTKDGNSYVGKIREIDSETIVLETELLGVLTLKQLNIKAVTEINPESMKGDEHWFENPQAARYFWAPNGYGLKKGEGYYQNVWVLFNQASVGLNDYLTVGVGIVPVFLFGGEVTPFWITPKVSIPVKKDKFNIGAGVLYGNIIGGGGEGSGIGLAYGITTFGSRDKNTSIGVGYAWADGEWAKYPTITWSFMARVSRNGYFISENYLITTADETMGLISIGGRKILKKVGLDFGGFIPLVEDLGGFYVIPWLGITVPFGKKG
jgi:hypothetical protein